MSLRLFAILILTHALINESHQSCTVKEIRRHEIAPYFRIIFQKYLHCELTPLSSDFHKEVDPLISGLDLSWIEFSDTQSVEVSQGAFKTLNKLPDLRLNDLGVRVIQPGAFDGLVKLKQLLLNNNKITRLEENFFNLSSLEVLDLSHNSIADVADNSFLYLKNLKALNLTNNFITRLSPVVFRNLTSLELLNLSFNKLTAFTSDSFQNLTVLVKLLLNNNNLHMFTSDLSYNSRLETLTINNNYLTTLQDLSLSNKSLYLNVSRNLIQKLNFKNFANLQSLDISCNDLTTLKKEFFENLAVNELYLDQNFLEILPKQIFSNLSIIKTLSLRNNEIRQLDANLLKNNSKLTRLYLDGNHLSQINFYLPNSLKTLGLSNNYFDSSVNLSSVKNLISLDLSHNKLTKVSFHFLENLKLLNLLNLGSNKINKLDIGAFHNIKDLASLDLSYNNISALELGTFVGIDNLLILDLSHNKLNEISEGIFHNMRSLRLLNLGYNNISFLSVENTLLHSFNLREVNLAGNNWPCSSLMAIMTDFKRAIIKPGNDHNVTNVNGIACWSIPKNPPGVVDLEQKLKAVDSKLSTNNSVLICILIVLIAGLMLKYLPHCLSNRKFLQPKSDQEIQLI